APQGEPLMIVVETDEVPARVQTLDATPPEWPNAWQPEGTPEEQEAAENRTIDARVEVMRDLVHRGLAMDAAMLDRRGRPAAAALARLDAAIAQGNPSAELVRIAPAVVAQAALRSPHATSLRSALSRLTEVSIVRAQVPGSRWALSGGCGVSFEEGDRQTIFP